MLNLVANNNDITTSVDSDYGSLIFRIRNLPEQYSKSAVENLIPFISTDSIRSRVKEGLWLRKNYGRSIETRWEILDTNQEQTIIIFWALYFSTPSITQKLQLLWLGLEDWEIWELLRINFGKHLQKIIIEYSNKYSLEEVRRCLWNKVIVLPDSQWGIATISFYPLRLVNVNTANILSQDK